MSDAVSNGRERKARAPRQRRKRRVAVRYSVGLAQEVCERTANGERWSSMAGAKGMPCASTLYDWLARYPDFQEALTTARRIGAEVRADKVLTVAEGATPASVTVDRLHIGALKWHVERDDKRLAKPDEPDLGAGRRLIIEVRRFERYTAEDGSTQVREILPRTPAGERE